MGTPTTEQLRGKAHEVDDLLYEAALVEMSAVQETLMSLVPRGFIEGLNTDMGYQTIHSVVAELAKVDASDYGRAADDVAAATSPDQGSPFTGLETEIDNIRDVVKPEMWDGEAARAYRSDHLNSYTDVAAQQMAALQELHGAMASFQDLLEGAYTSLDDVLQASKDALQSIIDGGNGAQDTSIIFAAVNAAVSITGAVATGGGSLAVNFAIAGGSIGVAQAMLTGGGSNTRSIAENARASVAKLQERITEFDQALASALRDDIDTIDARLNVSPGGQTKPIEIPRPAFADDPSQL